MFTDWRCEIAIDTFLETLSWKLPHPQPGGFWVDFSNSPPLLAKKLKEKKIECDS
jgi:hypothetical protein